MVFVHNSCLVFAGFDVDVAHKQGNLIFFIQTFPNQLSKAVDISGNRNLLRLAGKARQRIAVMHIGVDKSALARFRIFVSKGVTQAGGRIAVVAL